MARTGSPDVGRGRTVESVRVHAFEVPTDGPDGREQDGTLEWGATTLVLGLPLFRTLPAAHGFCAVERLRHLEYFHDHVRVERLLFDGTLSPDAGVLRPDPARPGLGLEVKWADAEPYRVHGS